jgi:thymidylate synthase ThyX
VLYETEHFTEDERRRLAPYFTNLDRPVFVLVNLPETVKGALFARYSRYPGTLRRLFLDEFADQLPDVSPDWSRMESQRATDLYERIFLGYGDDSVAQLGGAHVACEWVSNVLTKILQRPRLASYLEQSTRYIAYDQRTPGGSYRYWHDQAELGPRYAQAMDGLFDEYSRMIGVMQAWVAERHPRGADEPEAAHARAVKAKTFDICRGLLPAASLSHMGIYASGQAYEQLILHLFAHPLPEAREYGKMLLHELKHVIPSFLARIERPERGDAWIDHLKARERSADSVAERFGLADDDGPAESHVRLLSFSGDERDLVAAMLFESGGVSEVDARAKLDGLGREQVAQLAAELVGDRGNRRHRPNRGYERLRYRFEVVSDYGAFRDLQRHRMLTIQWQDLTPALGADVPEEIEAAGLGGDYRRALDASAAEYQRLQDCGMHEAAVYSLCLAYKIRYVLDLNAREAMHLIELRSGREGHPGYRQVAQDMYRQIADQHPIVAASMTHVDMEASPRLERIESETRTEVRASQAGGRTFAREPETDGADEDEDASDADRLFPAVS